MHTIITGDMRAALAAMPECSVDAIVTDPPYEIGFMGKSWDGTGIAFDPATWAECLRVLKPGGHMLAFGGSRTSHRIWCAIEDAGFAIRDSLQWIYGSGFPKSKGLPQAIDKHMGAMGHRGKAIKTAGEHALGHQICDGVNGAMGQHLGLSEESAKWNGWGTALKPAFEPICLARKPLAEKTVAANVLKHGCGGINVDGCRIGAPEDKRAAGTRIYASGKLAGGMNGCGALQAAPHDGLGRWPANVIFDEEAAALLDVQSGRLKAGVAVQKNKKAKYDASSFNMPGYGAPDAGYGDSGGASRFFYCAKASKKERERGLVPPADGGRANNHPTVKPISLMQWLCRMICPPGGVILDPFTGSGSTGVAAVLEGFSFIGVELSADYAAIAEARIAAVE